MLLFFAAVFLGAFLLFLVQPLMGRFVLPWQGGAPAVWTACLLFFQTALLAGYGYAHLLAKRLAPRRQTVVHLGLLALAMIWLPAAPHLPQTSSLNEPPMLAVFRWLTVTIGLPFALLAGSGPLLQHWFAHTQPQRTPYRLYALSNAGSLLALIAYPLLVEPNLTRHSQTIMWSGLYVVFTFAIGTCTWVVRRMSMPAPSATVVAGAGDAAAATAPTWSQRLVWMIWAGLATGLLAATTNALTLDVAAVPFLWIAPLVVYLVSLILTFEHPRWYRRRLFVLLLPIAMAASLDLRIFGSRLELGTLLSTHLLALAVATMICHGELYRTRPQPRFLTGFYLSLAAGGVLGTLITAVVLPRLCDHDNDLPLFWSALLIMLIAHLIRGRELVLTRWWTSGLLAAFLVVPALRPDATAGWGKLVSTWIELARQTAPQITIVLAGALLIHFRWPRGLVQTWQRRTAWSLALLAALISWFVVGTALQSAPGTVASRRGFFGEITVVDHPASDPRANTRLLAHGNTTHGIQLTHPDYRAYPTSYYSAESGIGRVLARANQHSGRRIGVVGLGTGTIASYGMPGDHFVFYEIDPNMIELAQACFTFLSDTAATVEIRRGDGRLGLAAENRQTPTATPYDILVLDAFSSDAVPIHLLTREAFAAYLPRLAEQGVLVVNISNRLVNLRPILEAHARHFGLYLAHLINRPGVENWWDFSSEWIVLAPSRDALDTPTITSWTGIAAPTELEGETWTDEFASLLSVLR